MTAAPRSLGAVARLESVGSIGAACGQAPSQRKARAGTSSRRRKRGKFTREAARASVCVGGGGGMARRAASLALPQAGCAGGRDEQSPPATGLDGTMFARQLSEPRQVRDVVHPQLPRPWSARGSCGATASAPSRAVRRRRRAGSRAPQALRLRPEPARVLVRRAAASPAARAPRTACSSSARRRQLAFSHSPAQAPAPRGSFGSAGFLVRRQRDRRLLAAARQPRPAAWRPQATETRWARSRRPSKSRLRCRRAGCCTTTLCFGRRTGSTRRTELCGAGLRAGSLSGAPRARRRRTGPSRATPTARTSRAGRTASPRAETAASAVASRRPRTTATWTPSRGSSTRCACQSARGLPSDRPGRKPTGRRSRPRRQAALRAGPTAHLRQRTPLTGPQAALPCLAQEGTPLCTRRRPRGLAAPLRGRPSRREGARASQPCLRSPATGRTQGRGEGPRGAVALASGPDGARLTARRSQARRRSLSSRSEEEGAP